MTDQFSISLAAVPDSGTGGAPVPEAPISVARADALLRGMGGSFGVEEVDLSAASGRVLASPIIADAACPPFDRVCMDGFALRSGNVTRGQQHFAIEAFVPAGRPPEPLQNSDACIEVMTGAPLPEGCDAVVPVEDVVRDGDLIELKSGVAPRPGRHVHARGRDRLPGDEMIPAGVVLTGPRLAAAAAVGAARVTVARRPRLHLILTGDELVPVAAQPGVAQIRMTHPYALGGLLSPWADLTWVHAPDDPDALRAAVDAGFAADALLLTGGVSAGKLDLVPDVLRDEGVHAVFHKVAQKPGKPLWVGQTSGGKTVFALPGNPVSAALCARRYVLPWLWRMLGLAGSNGAVTARLPLAAALSGDTHKTLFVPVRRRPHDEGGWEAEPLPLNGSGDFSGLAASDGFVELEPGCGTFAAGTPVPYYDWGAP